MGSTTTTEIADTATAEASITLHRIAIGLEYDGSRYHGWQRQKSVPTVQQAIEAALSRVADHPVAIVAAGRTDAGVHATVQVIHFDTPNPRYERAWVFGANTNLPADVRLLWAASVPSTFSARRSATLRRYRYLIYNNPIRPSLLRGQVSWYYKKLDIQRMREAGEHWLGEHDFSSFRSSECQSISPVRRLESLKIRQSGDLIIIDVAANAFLHHMVRNMVGVLKEVGSGEKPPIWAKEVLLARDRRKATLTAPPNGLYLVAVEYPLHFGLPGLPLTRASALGPWFLKIDIDEED